MRETRLSGSEGGGTGTTRSFLPLSSRPPEPDGCARRFGLQVAVILAGFSPNCMQEILEVSLRAWQDAFGLGKIAKAQFQQLA